jgi:hypothetical protein
MSVVPGGGALGAVVIALARTLIEEKIVSPDALRDTLRAIRRELAADGAPASTLALFDQLGEAIPPEALAARWYRLH